MSFSLIAEVLLRIEHKVDALLRFTNAPVMPMHFTGLSCPVCMIPVDYTVDMGAGIVIRRCNCKTGKVATVLPLMPVTHGDTTNGDPVEPTLHAGEDQPSRSSGRKAR